MFKMNNARKNILLNHFLFPASMHCQRETTRKPVVDMVYSMSIARWAWRETLSRKKTILIFNLLVTSSLPSVDNL